MKIAIALFALLSVATAQLVPVDTDAVVELDPTPRPDPSPEMPNKLQRIASLCTTACQDMGNCEEADSDASCTECRIDCSTCSLVRGPVLFMQAMMSEDRNDTVEETTEEVIDVQSMMDSMMAQDEGTSTATNETTGRRHHGRRHHGGRHHHGRHHHGRHHGRRHHHGRHHHHHGGHHPPAAVLQRMLEAADEFTSALSLNCKVFEDALRAAIEEDRQQKIVAMRERMMVQL